MTSDQGEGIWRGWIITGIVFEGQGKWFLTTDERAGGQIYWVVGLR
ncbi:MAG: hypothetical protein IH859_01150 [Chloroflexi bacterium]|nr:hypothetical protein [Chloroflexota bacterium]